MSGRPIKLVIMVVAVAAGGIAGYFAVQPTDQAVADQPGAEQPAAAAKAQPVPAKPAQTNSGRPSHVRMSNIKLLRQPVADDIAAMAAPQKAQPGGKESEEK